MRSSSAFRRLLLASTISNLGDGVIVAAFPLLAASISSSPQAVAGMTAAATLPWLLFGLPAGVVVDRVDRVMLMWVVDLLRAGVVGLLGLAVATGNASLPALYTVVFVLGVAETLFDSAAMAVVPTVVEGGSLERANGRLFAGQLTANQFVGPPIGALLFGLIAALPAFFDSLTFLVSSLLLVGLRVARAPRAVERHSLGSDLREGLVWVWRHHNIRTLAIGAAVINLSQTAAMAILVLFASDVLGLPEIGFGALFVASAMGALAGSLGAGRVAATWDRRRIVVASVGAMALSLLAIGLARSIPVTFVGMAIMSLGTEFWNVVAVSYRQGATPDRLLGRVMSAYRFIAYGSFPLGALLGGWLATRFRLETTFVVGGGLLAGLTIFVARALESLDAVEEQPAPS
ncbi:MAG: MFS transporter [Acidimicrobiia bacterium]